MGASKQITTDDLAWEAMRLIHAKNLRFTINAGGSTYHAKFTPRELLDEETIEQTADEALKEVSGQGELGNPMVEDAVKSEKAMGKMPSMSAMKGKSGASAVAAEA